MQGGDEYYIALTTNVWLFIYALISGNVGRQNRPLSDISEILYMYIYYFSTHFLHNTITFMAVIFAGPSKPRNAFHTSYKQNIPFSVPEGCIIHLQGRRLKACCLDSDFRITVGGEICDIYYRNTTAIYCYPPLKEPKDYESVHGAAPVIVSMGSVKITRDLCNKVNRFAIHFLYVLRMTNCNTDLIQWREFVFREPFTKRG